MSHCIRCGTEILGDGSEWADWTIYCQDCEWDAQFVQEFPEEEEESV